MTDDGEMNSHGRGSWPRASEGLHRAARCCVRMILLPFALAAAFGSCQRTPASPAPASPAPMVASPAIPAPPTPPAPFPAPASAALPTVFVIVMENHSYRELVGSPQAPYLNELIGAHGLAANYTDNGHHPSLPNYIVLTSGRTWDIHDDRGPDAHPLAHDNLGAQLSRAHVPWRAYMETMGTPCRLTDSYRYAPRHDPFVYYTSLRGDPAECAARVVDYSLFAADLAAGQHRFQWITPNLCDDAHDCPERHGDDWLRANVPPILASAAYRAGGTVFITWDEGERGSDQIVTLVLSTRLVRPGFRSDVRHGHASLLSTIEQLLGLPRLVNDPGSEPMMEFFR
jgi:hypothetical protein